MADDQQQSNQPPAGAPGSWSGPNQDPSAAPQPGFAPPPAASPPAWGQSQPPAWGQQPPAWGQSQPPAWDQQPPAWGQQPPAWGQSQPPMGAYPPAPGGYPPPGYPPYGGPGGYPPVGYGYVPSYAGFWIRLVAYIIDSFLLGVIIIVLAITVIGLLAVIPVALGYFPFLWWKRGGSFGQTLLGLRVVRAIDGGPIDGGMATIRGLVFWGELILAGTFLIGLLGFVWAAFEPRKRAWHDMAAGTVVIHA